MSIVVQAGGESKRMGSPKALMPFCGEPLIQRVLGRLAPIADELIVTANDQSSWDFLSDELGRRWPLRFCSDVWPERGALSGLYSALYHATETYVAVVACDMVFASAPLLLAERDALLQSAADAAVPQTSHGFEPFHAVYRRQTCLPLVLAALEAGEKKASSWFGQAHLLSFDQQMVLAADPRGGAFVNVNTPQELADLERRILSGQMTKLSEE
ncbi:MAG: molybdenum cofactor guanylyltransferase [Actinomycetia bacterium]|nr:molybdenum cofactor guanylyltransferase [Actinomycetes bacterium]